MVSSTTLLSDTILFIRNNLRSNITDPIAIERPSKEQFVMTSYPRRPITYPIITVQSVNLNGQKLGHQSEKSMITFTIEVRIWARNIKEKNNLFDLVYTQLRTNQFGGTTSSVTSEDLHDFQLLSAVDVDEEGEETIKSKVCEYKYMFIA